MAREGIRSSRCPIPKVHLNLSEQETENCTHRVKEVGLRSSHFMRAENVSSNDVDNAGMRGHDLLRRGKREDFVSCGDFAHKLAL